MRFLLIFIFVCTSTIYAQTSKLIIDAKTFEAKDKEGLSIFTGNVKLQRGKDRLFSDKLVIYMTAKDGNKARTPLRYIATGNAKFIIFTEDKHYIGTGKKIIYSPLKQEYRIFGNGTLDEQIEGTKLSGEEIFINLTTGKAKIKGTNKKPVRLIINIETKESTKSTKKTEKKETIKVTEEKETVKTKNTEENETVKTIESTKEKK